MKKIPFLIVLGSVLAGGAVSASAESQFEKPAKLSRGKKYIVDCGFIGEISLRFDPDGLSNGNLECYSEVTLISTWEMWAFIRTNDRREGYIFAWFLKPTFGSI